MKGLISIACILLGLGMQAQSVKGKVTDADGETLYAATVMLLQASDSVLASFAMSDDNGVFEIKRVPKGEYILRVNYVGFEGKDQKISVGDVDINAGTIKLDPNVLEEVVIEGSVDPIVLKKDTIEYNAAAFETKPNAVVEDLLKQMPGMEVERDGTVKAQGETVQKVLVDGKEFFGDDPKMATKNLPAEAVDKVQVYDQKSEFSQFSGVDDGNEEKTINLTLKDDHKKGTFGTVGGGYGTDDRYQLSANINQFKEDNQFSFIGKHNNINEQGFSTGEYISFMGGLGNLTSGGGGSFTIGGVGVPISNGLSDGFVNSTAAGLNFNRDFNDKLEMRASYLFSQIENITRKETDRTNFVNEESFDTNEASDNNSKGENHNINLNLKYKIDKSQDIELRNRIGFQNGDVVNSTNTTNSRDGSTTNSLSNYASDGTGSNINTDLTYRKKFPKIGRTLVTELNISSSSRDSKYDLETMVDDETPTIQEQTSLNNSTTFGAEIAYTEPVGKSKYVELRYERSVTDGINDKEFFDLSDGSRVFNQDLSSNFERNYTFNRTGLSFNYAGDDFRITTGTNYQFSTLLGTLPEQAQSFENDFNRFLPFLRTNYEITQSLGIGFNYNSRLNVPSVSQLQPVLDNSNPLNLYQGNPNLDAEYIHSGRLNFRYFDQFTSTSFFSFFNASYIIDNIVNSRQIDANSAITTTPVNADNSLTLTGYASFSRPFKKIKTKFRLSDELSRNEGFAIVNDVTSETVNINNTVSFTFENIKKKIVDWAIGMDYTNGRTKGSESANQNFNNQVYFVDATVYFLKKWSLSSIYDYNIYSSASFTGDQKVKLWEASLKKTMLKDDRGELKLSVFDILNQNRGVNRTTDFNYIQEERIASIGTYYMVSFTYRLSAFERQSAIQFDRGRRG